MDTNQNNPTLNEASVPQVDTSQGRDEQTGDQHSRDVLQTDDSPLAVSPHDPGHEGKPNNKMGTSYVPSTDEDHATKAHDIGTRTDHSAEASSPDAPPTPPPASGSTNPLQSTDKE